MNDFYFPLKELQQGAEAAGELQSQQRATVSLEDKFSGVLQVSLSNLIFYGLARKGKVLYFLLKESESCSRD